MAHATQMSAADTGLLVIDVQEKLLAKIPEADALVRNVNFLVDAARLLSVNPRLTPFQLKTLLHVLRANRPVEDDKVTR